VASVAATTYRDKYQDQQYDDFGGNYVNLYNEYAVGNTQEPLPLRNSVYRAGNSGTLLRGLVHVKDPNGAAHDPGRLAHDSPQRTVGLQGQQNWAEPRVQCR
jgi:hypothetical protein